MVSCTSAKALPAASAATAKANKYFFMQVSL
jgi:hypothetical protein